MKATRNGSQQAVKLLINAGKRVPARHNLVLVTNQSKIQKFRKKTKYNYNVEFTKLIFVIQVVS